MATVISAYKDCRGKLHLDPSSAIVADIAAALGRVGDEGGLTQGVAKLILDKRSEIEAAFADLDDLQGIPAKLFVVKPSDRAAPSASVSRSTRSNGLQSLVPCQNGPSARKVGIN